MLDDFRQAIRTLRQNPGLTFVTMALLTLGLGTSLTAIGVADSVLLDPLPYPESRRLVGFYEQNLEADIPRMSMSLASFQTWGDATDAFDLLAAYHTGHPVTLSSDGSGDGSSERLGTNFVSHDYFRLFGAEPTLGRIFTAEEHAVPMAHPVALLSHGLWQDRFGGRRDVLGARLLLNEMSFTVVGVLPEGFDDPGSTDGEIRIWLPLSMMPVTGYNWQVLQRPTTRFLLAAGRLAPGVTLQRARTEMNAIGLRLRESHPDAHAGYDLMVEPLDQALVGDFRSSAWALLGAAAFLLLIGCANAAHLLLVRASAQRRSTALRLALGLPRARLARQLILSGVITALPAGLVALVVGRWGCEMLLRFSPTEVPGFVEVSYGGYVILAGLGLTLVTGVIFGLVPILDLHRANLRGLLHQGARGSGGREAGHFRGLLIAAEIATAIVLTAGALLSLESFHRLASTGPGFDSRDLLTLKTDLPAGRYTEEESRTAFGRRLVEELETLPGVEKAMLWAPRLPSQADWYSSFVAGSKVDETTNEAVHSRYHTVSPGSLRELGIPLLAGRGLKVTDHAAAPPVVVVSRSLARALFGGEDPIGQQLRRKTLNTARLTVVGVVADSPLAGRTKTTASAHDLYMPYEQYPRRDLSVMLRAPKASALAPQAREVVAGLDPGLAVYDVRTMASRLSGEEEQLRFLAFLMSGFAGMAALLAALGLYSVIAYAVGQERREIGIRLALGGRPRDITVTVAGRAGRSVALGMIIGLGGVALLGRFFAGALYGVEPMDPSILTAVVALIAIASLAAVLVPVRRALGIDPTVVLRAE